MLISVADLKCYDEAGKLVIYEPEKKTLNVTHDFANGKWLFKDDQGTLYAVAKKPNPVQQDFVVTDYKFNKFYHVKQCAHVGTRFQVYTDKVLAAEFSFDIFGGRIQCEQYYKADNMHEEATSYGLSYIFFLLLNMRKRVQRQKSTSVIVENQTRSFLGSDPGKVLYSLYNFAMFLMEHKR